MNPLIVSTQELIDFFDRASECDSPGCDLSEIHQEAQSIAEDLRLYKDECESEAVTDGYLHRRKAELSDRMDAWDLSVALLEYGPFPPDTASEFLQ
jgi:hypothetical protein